MVKIQCRANDCVYNSDLILPGLCRLQNILVLENGQCAYCDKAGKEEDEKGCSIE